MPHPSPDDERIRTERIRTASADFHWLVRVLDPHLADRRAGPSRRIRSREHRLPALLLARMRDGGTVTDRAEPDPELAGLVLDYMRHLKSSPAGADASVTSFAPHAVVGDVWPEPAEGQSDGPHVLLLENVAQQLKDSVPTGAGTLRLPEFDTLLAVLRADVQEREAEAQRRALRRVLSEAYTRKLHEDFPLTQLREITDGWWGAPFRLLDIVAAWSWRRWYGMRLDRRHVWVSRMLDLPGRSFLKAAVHLRVSHRLALAQEAAQPPGTVASRDEELVREILLTALIHDLAGAARPRAWSRLRPRRAWPFVVLLPAVGGPGSACREVLDTYAAVSRDIGSSPLLVLGAATGALPPYAASPPTRTVPAQRDGLGAHPTGHEVTALFSAAISGHSTDPVHVLTVPRAADEGTAVADVPQPAAMDFRRPRARDWWRPVAAATAVAVLCAGLVVLSRALTELVTDGGAADSCRHVDNGEVVGLTDGNDGCDLAHGEYADDLRDLEKILGHQNAQVDTDKPYRTIVFFAPLSVGSESKRTAPIGFQTLRGALLAQEDVNGSHRKAQVPVRLLVANAGEYFHYGSSGGLNTANTSGVDVAQMIIDRADRDHIAAVMGLHQSRPESQQAAIELGGQGITVLGTGVSGQRMVDGDSPSSYFQLSPVDARIAAVMTAFARNSPQLQALTSPAADGSGPAAVVVYDPKDTYFSADLAHRFDASYRSTGPVHLVKYGEMEDGRATRGIAGTVCTLVHGTNGFVLYAGRSSVMEDLFKAMQTTQACRARVSPVPVLAESPAPDVVLHPELMRQKYDALKLFYNQFSLPDPEGSFAETFDAAYHLSAENDAALGYDAVEILSEAMNDLVTNDPGFSPRALVNHLQDPGVQDYVGQSGVITLDSDHHYPPNKEIHVREITNAGDKLTDLTCGVLSQGARNATHWGPGDRFDCPVDPAS
ncbi:type 1 periplasmic-binding domain-containing protein [Streptomyces triticiradicis]|nr:hypothetical protein [Streptomyces triticiradicis]